MERCVASRALLLALLALVPIQGSCVLPLRWGPAAEGRVVDSESGRPVAGALVAVRYETWYDDVLPDRDLLGHAEVRSGPDGRFRIGPLRTSGLTAWPLAKRQARVVGVLAEGYRCPEARALRGPTTLRLEAARDAAERRESCRPLAVRPGEASAYMEQWRALHLELPAPEAEERQRDMERVLAARAIFGFGQNCVGPVHDLALDPSGRRVALLAGRDGDSAGSAVQIVNLAGERPRLESSAPVELHRHQSLAWTHPGELVLWEPSTQQRRLLSSSILGDQLFQVVWKAPAGAAEPPTPLSGGSGPSRPLQPADLNDEGEARWMGRAFSARRDVDPTTGLGRDLLEVTRPDGSRDEIALPGETCGAPGRFGRVHYRLVADGRAGVDLRFIDGGCRALHIDLESGASTILDESAQPAQCRVVRSVPAQHMHSALRGYMQEVRLALEEAGADPTMAFALHVRAEQGTVAITRDLAGGKHSVELPPFPLATPLRRIEVTVAGGRSPIAPIPASQRPAALRNPL